MTTAPTDRDILLACAALVGVGLALFAVGALLDGFHLIHRIVK